MPYIKGNMTGGETEDDVDIEIEIPPHILKNTLDNNYKRKVDSSANCCNCEVQVSSYSIKDPENVDGDRQARLKEDCNWGLTQVKSDR
jgi:hypothetical protein